MDSLGWVLLCGFTRIAGLLKLLKLFEKPTRSTLLQQRCWQAWMSSNSDAVRQRSADLLAGDLREHRFGSGTGRHAFGLGHRRQEAAHLGPIRKVVVQVGKGGRFESLQTIKFLQDMLGRAAGERFSARQAVQQQAVQRRQT